MNGIGNAEAYMQQMGYANTLTQFNPSIPQTKDNPERRLSHQERFDKLDRLVMTRDARMDSIDERLAGISNILEMILERL